MTKAKWIKVVFADTLPVCEGCEEPICTKHGEHFFACECPGPDQDDEYDYKEIKGILYAKQKPTT